MIDELRLFIAVSCFLLGLYLLYDLFISGFNIVVFGASFVSLTATHFIKPKRNPSYEGSIIWDILDFIVDIPFKAISLFLRGVGKLSKSDIGGIDL